MANYTFSSAAEGASATTTQTWSAGIGASTSPYVWVAIAMVAGLGASATLQVGAVSLNLDVETSDTTSAIFSGRATGLSGTQTFTLTCPNGNGGVVRMWCVWYDSANETIAVHATASEAGTGSSVTLAVTNTNYMFALGAEPGTVSGTFNTSTVAPTAERAATDGSSWTTQFADWAIAATNASFNVTNDDFVYLAAASYTVTPASSAALATNLTLMGVG